MRILIVEDEPGIFNFLKQGLEEETYVVAKLKMVTKKLILIGTGRPRQKFRTTTPILF